MTMIKIDRDKLMEELYKIRSLLPDNTEQEVIDQILKTIQYVQYAPLDVGRSQYARIKVNG